MAKTAPDAHDIAARELCMDKDDNCGWCDDIAAALRRAAADAAKAERSYCADLASPSRWEGWPGTVTDALLTVQDAIRARGTGGA